MEVRFYREKERERERDEEYDVVILMSVQINEHTVSRFVHKDPSISYSNRLQHIPKKAIHLSIVILQRYTRQLYIFFVVLPISLSYKDPQHAATNSFHLPPLYSLLGLLFRLISNLSTNKTFFHLYFMLLNFSSLSFQTSFQYNDLINWV